MATVDVGAVAGLDEGVPHVAQAGNREIVLLRWHGEVYALRNICPHQTQSFARGGVRPTVVRGTSTPGCFAISDDPVLMCPWHGWTFDAREGVCTSDPSYRIKTYPARVVDGRVLVEI